MGTTLFVPRNTQKARRRQDLSATRGIEGPGDGESGGGRNAPRRRPARSKCRPRWRIDREARHREDYCEGEGVRSQRRIHALRRARTHSSGSDRFRHQGSRAGGGMSGRGGAPHVAHDDPRRDRPPTERRRSPACARREEWRAATPSRPGGTNPETRPNVARSPPAPSGTSRGCDP